MELGLFHFFEFPQILLLFFVLLIEQLSVLLFPVENLLSFKFVDFSLFLELFEKFVVDELVHFDEHKI